MLRTATCLGLLGAMVLAAPLLTPGVDAGPSAPPQDQERFVVFELFNLSQSGG